MSLPPGQFAYSVAPLQQNSKRRLGWEGSFWDLVFSGLETTVLRDRMLLWVGIFTIIQPLTVPAVPSAPSVAGKHLKPGLSLAAWRLQTPLIYLTFVREKRLRKFCFKN